MKNKLVAHPLKRAAKEKNETNQIGKNVSLNSEEAHAYFMGSDSSQGSSKVHQTVTDP
uniref:Uncharacterized protein n=1 Tax=viral metagenome TaxID=1070528 RepID=A0A6C0IWE5_9ZZZZ